MRDRVSRRSLLAAGAAGIGATFAGCTEGNGNGNGGGDDGSPTVGILEDRSGNFQLNGTSKWQATRLAIEEINEEGGILGEEIEIFDPDPQSDNERYQELTERAILQENVDALWAGYSSATREAIRPIINREEQLYFYTTQYEGGVCDDTIFAVGATARQQLGAVTPYLAEEFGEDIYIIAADYNFGQLSGDWVNVIADENGYNIVGEEYIPLDESDFGSVINRIQAEDPDFIMSMLVGANHENFYDQRDSNDLTIPIGSSTTMAQGHEHIRYEPDALTDVYAGVSYMEDSAISATARTSSRTSTTAGPTRTTSTRRHRTTTSRCTCGATPSRRPGRSIRKPSSRSWRTASRSRRRRGRSSWTGRHTTSPTRCGSPALTATTRSASTPNSGSSRRSSARRSRAEPAVTSARSPNRPNTSPATCTVISSNERRS